MAISFYISPKLRFSYGTSHTEIVFSNSDLHKSYMYKSHGPGGQPGLSTLFCRVLHTVCKSGM